MRGGYNCGACSHDAWFARWLANPAPLHLILIGPFSVGAAWITSALLRSNRARQPVAVEPCSTSNDCSRSGMSVADAAPAARPPKLGITEFSQRPRNLAFFIAFPPRKDALTGNKNRGQQF
jgi:hypothetical protein